MEGSACRLIGRHGVQNEPRARICQHCIADTGLYDFGNDCCLVRFILGVPAKELRAAYLDRWTLRYGNERIAQVKILITEAWEAKRKEVLSFGRKGDAG